ncbi:MAG: class I SAM-dependent methyltransferase [Chloroflexota bacterium]
MNIKKNHKRNEKAGEQVVTSWDGVAAWYDGWMGQDGSRHHRELAIPTLIDLLVPQADERIIDIGAGQGVLAPHMAEAGATYVGVDASSKLLRKARRHHGQAGTTFVQGDARRLASLVEVEQNSFAAAVFLLSIQDMSPLESVLASASEVLVENGRLVILMTHPCFRIPRQSGWGWDEQRKLRYRRVDSYLTRLAVPMKSYKTKRPTPQGNATTRSFHRPLQDYINGLSACGFMIDQIKEVPAGELAGKKANYRKANRLKAAKRAKTEIPLFLGIRAIKITK